MFRANQLTQGSSLFKQDAKVGTLGYFSNCKVFIKSYFVSLWAQNLDHYLLLWYLGHGQKHFLPGQIIYYGQLKHRG